MIQTKTHLYNGVTIEEVIFYKKPYFYPSFNGNLEFESLDEIKKWIDGPLQLVREQTKWLAEQMGVSHGQVFNFINNMGG